jgi:hypothetical protein
VASESEYPNSRSYMTSVPALSFDLETALAFRALPASKVNWRIQTDTALVCRALPASVVNYNGAFSQAYCACAFPGAHCACAFPGAHWAGTLA